MIDVNNSCFVSLSILFILIAIFIYLNNKPSIESFATCKAIKGLNHGATDDNCQICSTGYKFWPCGDDPKLCDCSGKVKPSRPSSHPSPQPTSYPSPQPTSYPSPQATSFPSPQPTSYPSPQPTSYPSPQPTSFPSPQPTSFPSSQPTSYPSPKYTSNPRHRLGQCGGFKEKDIILNKKTEAQIGKSCKKYDKYIKGDVPMTTIANAWKDAGMNPKICPYALIIASGEAEPSKKAGYINLDGSGESGIFQCDTCRGPSSNSKGSCSKDSHFMGENCQLNLKNPCINAWGSVNTVLIPSNGFNPDFKYYNPGCINIGQGTQWSQSQQKNVPKPYAQPSQTKQTMGNVGKCNFIGPFCHQQYSGEGAKITGGTAWSGGQNNKLAGQLWNGDWSSGGPQDDGFPYYYYEQMLAVNQKPIPRTTDELEKQALETAQSICDKAYNS